MKKVLSIWCLVMVTSIFSIESKTSFSINIDSLITTWNNPVTDFSRDDLLFTHSTMEEFDGINPIDICYVPSLSKIFVYGNRYIHVYNSITYAFIDEISISEYGQFEAWHSVPMKSIYSDDRLVYSDNRIYCATDSYELLMIDANNHSILDVIQRPNLIAENSSKIHNIIVKYNPYENRLYWIINDYDNNNNYISAGSVLSVVQIENNLSLSVDYQQAYQGWSNKMDDNFIRGIEFNQNNIFYLSVNHEVKFIESLSFTEVAVYNTTYYAGLLNHVSYFASDKLICTPYFEENNPNTAEIMIIDLNTGLESNIPTNSFNIYDTCIDTFNHLIYYLCNFGGATYIGVIDYQHNTINEYFYTDTYINETLHMLHIYEDNSLFISLYSGIYVIDCNSANGILLNSYIDDDIRYKSVFGNSKMIYTVNVTSSQFEVFDFDGYLQNEIDVGENAHLGVIAELSNKLVFYDTAGKNLSTYDIENDSYNRIELPARICDVDVDDMNGAIFVLTANDCIYAYDISDLTTLGSTGLTYSSNWYFTNGIHYEEDNGLFYAGSEGGLDIWEIDYSGGIGSFFIPITTFNNCSAYNFIYDDTNQRMFAIGHVFGYGYNNIIIIDNQLNYTSFQIPYNFGHFVYCSTTDRIYFTDGFTDGVGGKLYKFNPNNGQYEVLLNDPTCLLYLTLSTNDILYISNFNQVYCLDLISETLEAIVELPNLCTQMKSNPYNDKCYILHILKNEFDYEMEILTIEENNSYMLSSLELDVKERFRSNGMFGCYGLLEKSSLIFNNSDLYVVRGNNVIHEIECETSETKILSRGWNWESFPRLERDANGNVNAPLLFSEIQNFASGVEFLETIAYNSNLKYYSDPGYWTNDPWYIQSPWLYKIDIDPEDDWILELCGERLSPTEFVSSPDPQNPNFMGDGTWYWLGYWLPNTQDMDVAFPENVWQWVKHVKAEEWYYGIPENNRDPVIEPKPSNQMRALEYGKGYMVQFKTVDEGFPEEGLPPFLWSNGETSEGYERTQTENFDYEELPDYDVIDVLGIPENVIEIGVFQDSVCVGAVVVQDSSQQILVYVENSLREQIPYNFEVVTNNRSIEEVIDYSVFNNDEGIFEQRSLIAGSQPYSVIKFGNIGISQNNTPNINKTILKNNYPNPFNPETNISFSIPSELFIKLTIYNLKGQKVRELVNGQFVSGYHSVVWNGKDDNGKQVGSGLYFYKLKTDDKEISKKMLLLK